MSPRAESVSAVNAWLDEHGLSATPITPAGDWLMIDVPVCKANELFETEFSIYTHDATGKQAIRTLSYSIPTELVGHLDLVHPTVTYVTPDLFIGLQHDIPFAASPIPICASPWCSSLSATYGHDCSPSESMTVSIPRTG